MTEKHLPGPSGDPALDATVALVVDACSETHRRLGPGLPAEAYVEALSHEIALAGVAFQPKVALPVFYRGVRLDAAYRVDLCVSGAVAVDVRVVDALLPVHRAELKSKLRASGLTAGVLVNFRTARLGDGLVVIRRARSIRRPAELSAPLFARVLPSPGAEPVPEAPRMP